MIDHFYRNKTNTIICYFVRCIISIRQEQKVVTILLRFNDLYFKKCYTHRKVHLICFQTF